VKEVRDAGGVDVLALVVVRVADDHHGCVGRRRGGRIVAVVVHDRRVREGGPQAVDRGHHVWRTDVARAAVAQVGDRGESPDDGEPPDARRVERQEGAFVPEEHHALDGRAARQGAMPSAGDDARVARHVEDAPEAEQRRHDALGRTVDERPGEPAVRHRRRQVLRTLLHVRHLDVEPRHYRAQGVAESELEVRDDEAVEAPFVAQDRGQQRGALAAPRAVQRVVGAHHARDAFADHAREVRQVHFVERPLVGRHVDLEARVLDRVAGEVLHARHGVALHAAGERGAHLAHVMGILPVRLLCAAPAGVAKQVHADAAVERRADRTQLAPDRLADLLLERGIERGAARHAHREGRRVADDDAAGPVAEREAGDAEPRHGGGRIRVFVVSTLDAVDEPVPEGRVAVETFEPFLGRHRRDEHARLDVRVGTVADPGGRGRERSRHGARLLSPFARSGL
jgi:hypothetical protein